MRMRKKKLIHFEHTYKATCLLNFNESREIAKLLKSIVSHIKIFVCVVQVPNSILPTLEKRLRIYRIALPTQYTSIGKSTRIRKILAHAGRQWWVEMGLRYGESHSYVHARAEELLFSFFLFSCVITEWGMNERQMERKEIKRNAKYFNMDVGCVWQASFIPQCNFAFSFFEIFLNIDGR